MPAACTSSSVRSPSRRLGASPSEVLAEQPRRPPRAPRRGPGARRRRARRGGRRARRRRPRAAGRAGWLRRRSRPPRAPGQRSRRAGRGRRRSARAPQHLGVARRRRRPAARAAAPTRASGSRSRKPGPNQRSADALTSAGVPAERDQVDPLGPRLRRRRSWRRCTAARRPRRGRGRRASSCRPTAPPTESPGVGEGRADVAALGQHLVDRTQHAGGEVGHRPRALGHRAVVAVARQVPARPRRSGR